MAEGGAGESSISPCEENHQVEAQNKISVVLVGNSGSGKSTLKSNAFGIEEKLEVSTVTNNYVTKEVKQHGVTFVITDTVGIQTSQKDTLERLCDHMKKNRDVDILIIYCISVDMSSKFEPNEIVMESLDKTFGHNIWKKCIIAFTFSNQVIDWVKKKEYGIQKFQRHIKDYASKFEDKLKQLKVENINVKTVFDLSPAAKEVEDHSTILAIPVGDDEDDEVLPGVESQPFKIILKDETLEFETKTWIDVLFMAIFTKCNPELKRILLIYHYGLTPVQIGAITGCVLGIPGLIPGMVVGAAIGAAAGAVVGAAFKKGQY